MNFSSHLPYRVPTQPIWWLLRSTTPYLLGWCCRRPLKERKPRRAGPSWCRQWWPRWRSWSRWCCCRGIWRRSPWPHRQWSTRKYVWSLTGEDWSLNTSLAVASPAQKPSVSGLCVMYCHPWRLVWLQNAWIEMTNQVWRRPQVYHDFTPRQPSPVGELTKFDKLLLWHSTVNCPALYCTALSSSLQTSYVQERSAS